MGVDAPPDAIRSLEYGYSVAFTAQQESGIQAGNACPYNTNMHNNEEVSKKSVKLKVWETILQLLDHKA